MKKIKTILITALTTAMLFSLTGCGEPGDLYEKAAEKYDNAEGITVSFSSEISISEGSDISEASYSGTLMIDHDEDYVMSLEGSLTTVSEDGKSTVTEVKAYYKDGRYYANMAGGLYYTDLSWEEVLSQIGLCSFASGLAKEDFQAISIRDSAEGDIIEYVISPENAVKIYGLSGQMERFSKMGTGEGVISLREVTGNVCLDGKTPLSQKFVISGAVINGERVRNITNTINNTFSISARPQGITLPSLSGYTELEK